MRRTFGSVAFGSVALAAAVAWISASVACAASGNEAENAGPPDGGGTPDTISDGEAPKADAAEQDLPEPKCSAAGWCVTALPDADLVMKDIWPFPSRAFAIAESPTLGVKVLEWTEVDATWRYIDDSTQNESGLGRFAGTVWAPSEDEVYYAVSPGYVYHGTRATGASTWSWTSSRLGEVTTDDPNDGNPASYMVGYRRVAALGVWGTSRDDVYAWFKDTIYHRTSADGGAPQWVAEHVATGVDDPAERFFFFGAAGTSSDDVWFAGARHNTNTKKDVGCPLLVRKTAGAYQTVADARPQKGIVKRSCAARPGALLLSAAPGWLMNIQALDTNRVIALRGQRDVARISVDGASYSVALAPVSQVTSPSGLYSLATLAGDVWLGGPRLVLRGPADVWDGGAYEVSTISLNGGPLETTVFQIRGTSNTNLWAIGDRYALHKTTP
jgi:hypothetical protein